ncbi:MAG: hypothetical protein JJE09_10620 [Bacteroidia bacterium]|nr:hypothetical protein [Bacteroidia bacterium]
MSKIFIVFIGFILLLGSCTQRLICPAYQSAFIYDKEAMKKKFSYLKEDSTPKIFTASSSKNKYLVAVPESYRKKLRALQTVEMKAIYPVIPDSLKMDAEGDLLLAERDIPDSAAQASSGLDPEDSTYAISKAKEKFNVDQDNYMWYFRDVLVLPDVRAALMGKVKNEGPSAPSGKKEKKGFLGFFKNLFGKNKSDSSAMLAPSLQPDSDSTAVSLQKKDIKKKSKKEKKVEEKKKDPAKKDEDDGF